MVVKVVVNDKEQQTDRGRDDCAAVFDCCGAAAAAASVIEGWMLPWCFSNFQPPASTAPPLRCVHGLLGLAAGLCHDLGHGPFSHVFEKELLPKLFPGQPSVVQEWCVNSSSSNSSSSNRNSQSSSHNSQSMLLVNPAVVCCLPACTPARLPVSPPVHDAC